LKNLTAFAKKTYIFPALVEVVFCASEEITFEQNCATFR